MREDRRKPRDKVVVLFDKAEREVPYLKSFSSCLHGHLIGSIYRQPWEAQPLVVAIWGCLTTIPKWHPSHA